MLRVFGRKRVENMWIKAQIKGWKKYTVKQQYLVK